MSKVKLIKSFPERRWDYHAHFSYAIKAVDVDKPLNLWRMGSDVRPMVIFQAVVHLRPLSCTNLYCLVSEDMHMWTNNMHIGVDLLQGPLQVWTLK